MGPVRTRLLTDRDDLDRALRLLDRAEQSAGAPLVDEAERERLEAAVAGGALAEHHHAVLADLQGDCVGYAGLVVADGDRHGSGDVAFRRDLEERQDALRALLGAVDAVARDHDAHGTQLWVRHATADDLLQAVASGYAVDRRLAVLGHRLTAARDASDDAIRGTDVSIRAATEQDVPAVVEVLADAYRGTPDAGWDRGRFDDHATGAWFRFEDLLVADDGRELLGVHWTKRRDQRTGEVYNLAVTSRGQGRGLGRALLDAGLDHLHEVGCDDVLLWVDLANEAAVRLYARAGFTTRWEDIAFTRHTRRVGRHEHA